MRKRERGGVCERECEREGGGGGKKKKVYIDRQDRRFAVALLNY